MQFPLLCHTCTYDLATSILFLFVNWKRFLQLAFVVITYNSWYLNQGCVLRIEWRTENKAWQHQLSKYMQIHDSSSVAAPAARMHTRSQSLWRLSVRALFMRLVLNSVHISSCSRSLHHNLEWIAFFASFNKVQCLGDIRIWIFLFKGRTNGLLQHNITTIRT